jgi:two-component system nitrogen regulation response regulator GlnG
MAGFSSLADLVEAQLAWYFSSHKNIPLEKLYDQVMSEVERPLIGLCLERCKGNQLKAARILGINRNTLAKKIRQLGIVKEGQAHGKV